MTLEELIRWRAMSFGIAPSPEAVAASLSVENLPYEAIPKGGYKAVTQFRHLRTDARIRKCQAVLRYRRPSPVCLKDLPKKLGFTTKEWAAVERVFSRSKKLRKKWGPPPNES